MTTSIRSHGVAFNIIVVLCFAVLPWIERCHGGETHVLSLNECLAMAMEKNHQRPASRYAVAAAEAQHKQALSAYWPQFALEGGYQLMDESPNFIFPAGHMGIPAQAINVPASNFKTPSMMVTIPANAFGPGFPPQNVQLPVASQTVNVPAQSFNVPAQQFDIPQQDVKLMDEESWFASLKAQWLVWDGGMRKGMRGQSKAGVEAAREALRRSELQIKDSVTRMYYGAVLARQLHRVGKDTLSRMEATLNLTETMYKEGSGEVKKTDFLNNKVMVETLRATVALLSKNEIMAQAALAYNIGLSWDQTVEPNENEIPFHPSSGNLDELVSEAYQFSPDWKRLEAGIKAAEAALKEARSGYFPKLAVTGELHKWWNDYDAGMASEDNKEGWTVGVGMEIPLFKGGLTKNKIAAAKANLMKLRHETFLLREGIGLQVRDVFLGLHAMADRFTATKGAMETSIENRDLNTRAYQNDLVETEDVIQAQLMEAFMTAQHYKMRFDHAELNARLTMVVGTEIQRLFTAN